MSDLHRADTPGQQVARAVRCCATIAKLTRKYGGAVQFHRVPPPANRKPSEYAKAPASGYTIKRTLKGLA